MWEASSKAIQQGLECMSLARTARTGRRLGSHAGSSSVAPAPHPALLEKTSCDPESERKVPECQGPQWPAAAASFSRDRREDQQALETAVRWCCNTPRLRAHPRHATAWNHGQGGTNPDPNEGDKVDKNWSETHCPTQFD